MTKHYGILVLDRDKADEIQSYYQDPKTQTEPGATLLDREHVFPNGVRMLVQVIAATDPEENEPWSQGVLLSPDGEELSMTEGYEGSVIGDYSVPFGGDEYVVTVLSQAPPGFEIPGEKWGPIVEAFRIAVQHEALARRALSVIDTALDRDMDLQALVDEFATSLDVEEAEKISAEGIMREICSRAAAILANHETESE